MAAAGKRDMINGLDADDRKAAVDHAPPRPATIAASLRLIDHQRLVEQPRGDMRGN
jgi:hypothetical protein